MTKNSKVTLALAVLASALLGVPAHADLITIDQITDAWQNPVGGSNIVISNVANPGVDTIRWGTGSPQSGYDWNSGNTPFVVSTGVPFALGQFTHRNFPIGAGTAITQVELSFAVGTFESPLTLGAIFTFLHDETTNTGPGCCNDLVTISGGFSNVPFQDNGGNTYFFSLLGFSTDGGITFSTDFSTVEGLTNQADLYAEIQPIPEPASLLLLASGLIGGAVRARRRQK